MKESKKLIAHSPNARALDSPGGIPQKLPTLQFV